MAAIRAGAAGGDGLPAAAEVLSGNTCDLAGAIASPFGAAAAKRLRRHIDQVFSYTAGVIGRDARRCADALAKLDAFP